MNHDESMRVQLGSPHCTHNDIMTLKGNGMTICNFRLSSVIARRGCTPTNLNFEKHSSPRIRFNPSKIFQVNPTTSTQADSLFRLEVATTNDSW